MNCGDYKIDLGCGYSKRKGFIGVDTHDYSKEYPKGEFIQCDLERGILPFCSNSAVALVADNVLEHIFNLIPLLNDCWRVLKSGGTFEIIVPRAGSEASFKDPTHIRFFLGKSFLYFTEGNKRAENYGIKPWRISKEETKDERITVILVKP